MDATILDLVSVDGTTNSEAETNRQIKTQSVPMQNACMFLLNISFYASGVPSKKVEGYEDGQ